MTYAKGSGYRPISDYALTELQVRDVLHHPVLTGLYSRADWDHPGPLLFYAIAPFYWVTGGASVSMNLAALTINALAVTGIAWFSWRRGGTAMVLCALLACALVMRTMGADFLYDPWNNYVVTLPFGLLLFSTWSLMCGDRWAFPVTVVVASFLAQTHVGFVALALPLLALGAVCFVVPALRRGTARERRAAVWWTTGLSALLFVVLWSPVIVDVVVHDPSNLSRTLRYFRTSDEPSHSLAQGWRVVTAQFGLVPEWLTRKRFDTVGYGESPFLLDAPLPWLLVPVVAAGVWLWVRRRLDVARARYLAVVIAVALGLGIVAVMQTLGPALDYRLRWTWMIPVVAFVLVTWVGWQLLVQARPRAVRVLVPTAGVLIGVVSVVNLVTAATVPAPWKADSHVMSRITPQVVGHLASKRGQVVLTDRFSNAAWYTRGLVLQLERAGYDARVPADRQALFGAHRVVDDRQPVQARLLVGQNQDLPALLSDPNLELVARWRPTPGSSFAQALRKRDRLKREYEAGRLPLDEYVARTREVLPSPPHVPVAEDLAVFVDHSPAAARSG